MIDREHLARLILSLAARLAGQLLYNDMPENHVRALVDMASVLCSRPQLHGRPRSTTAVKNQPGS